MILPRHDVRGCCLVSKSKVDSLTASGLVQRTPSFTCVLESPGRQLSIETVPACASSHIDLHAVAMNGFNARGMNEGDFGESKSASVVKAFDAFRESHYLLHPLLGAL